MKEDLGSSITGSAEGGVEAGGAVCEGRRAERTALVDKVQVICIVEAGGAVVRAITSQAVVY